MTTNDGRTYSGVIRYPNSDVITIRSPYRAIARLARDEIDEMTPSTVSVVPKGLDGALSQTELRNLLFYSKSLR